MKTLEGLRVLIAEDETIIRLDLRQMLEQHGAFVCGEARGLEPLEVEVRSSSGQVWPLRVRRTPDGALDIDAIPPAIPPN